MSELTSVSRLTIASMRTVRFSGGRGASDADLAAVAAITRVAKCVRRASAQCRAVLALAHPRPRYVPRHGGPPEPLQHAGHAPRALGGAGRARRASTASRGSSVHCGTRRTSRRRRSMRAAARARRALRDASPCSSARAPTRTSRSRWPPDWRDRALRLLARQRSGRATIMTVSSRDRRTERGAHPKGCAPRPAFVPGSGPARTSRYARRRRATA